MKRAIHLRFGVGCMLGMFGALAAAQGDAVFTARIQLAARDRAAPAVLWLHPVGDTPVPAPPHPGHFTLVQKNRMFNPHMLVIPVGSVVAFPNADPFFHNVFSMFNGKRFDLGLYEAGTSKDVVFSREGVSYIFCNIHPEMSAVVMTLSTPLYSIATRDGAFQVDHVAPGEYELHIWVEGLTQLSLNRLVRRVHVRAGMAAVILDARDLEPEPATHLNKFGQPYAPVPNSPY